MCVQAGSGKFLGYEKSLIDESESDQEKVETHGM